MGGRNDNPGTRLLSGLTSLAPVSDKQSSISPTLVIETDPSRV